MSKMFISGGMTELSLGRPTTSDKYDASGFLLADSELNGVQPGAFLAFGPSRHRYTGIKANTTAGDIAGIYIKPVIKSATTWPASNKGPELRAGEAGDCLIRGDIAVRLGDSESTSPKEGGTVFLGTTGAEAGHVFTSTSADRIELPNYKFLGISAVSDGVKLTAVRRLY